MKVPFIKIRSRCNVLYQTSHSRISITDDNDLSELGIIDWNQISNEIKGQSGQICKNGFKFCFGTENHGPERTYLESFWSILFWEIGRSFLSILPTRGRYETIAYIPTWILRWLFCCRDRSLSDFHLLKLETLLDLSAPSIIESTNRTALKSFIIRCIENIVISLRQSIWKALSWPELERIKWSWKGPNRVGKPFSIHGRF